MDFDKIKVVPLMNGREYIGIVVESHNQDVVVIEKAHVLVRQRTANGEIEVGLAPGRVYGKEDTVEVYKEFLIEKPYAPNDDLLKSYVGLISADEMGLHLPPQKSIITP